MTVKALQLPPPNALSQPATTFTSGAKGWCILQSAGGAVTLAEHEPLPDGNGFIFQTSGLEQKQILAGTWTPRLTVTALQAVTADFKIRVYLYNTTTASYTTQVVTSSTGATALSAATATALNFTQVPGPLIALRAGDRIYVDIVANITVNTSDTQITFDVHHFSTSALQTPGYTNAPPLTTGTDQHLLLLILWQGGVAARIRRMLTKVGI